MRPSLLPRLETWRIERAESEVGMTVFRTRLCELLAIDYPVLQSGMGLIAGPDLVAEVSGAGALGIVAGFMLAPTSFARRSEMSARGRIGRSASIYGSLPSFVPRGRVAGLQ